VVLVWFPFSGVVVVLIFHKRTISEWVGRGVLFFFGFVSWLVWSLGGGKGGGTIF
jgi:hypothetical protein